MIPADRLVAESNGKTIGWAGCGHQVLRPAIRTFLTTRQPLASWPRRGAANESIDSFLRCFTAKVLPTFYLDLVQIARHHVAQLACSQCVLYSFFVIRTERNVGYVPRSSEVSKNVSNRPVKTTRKYQRHLLICVKNEVRSGPAP